jgi:dihydroflavonol-4-reductase
MFDVHTAGVRTVLDAAPPAARIVHTSSIVAVGASRTGQPVDETAPPVPTGGKLPYVRAKRAAEGLALAAARAGRDVVVVCPTYLAGPGDHGRSVMGQLFLRVWRGRMPVAPPGGVNVADVRDVAAGHLLAADLGRAGRRYILGGTDRTFAALMGDLARAAGYRPRACPTVPRWSVAAAAGVAEAWARLSGREPFPSFGQARMGRYYWFARSDRAAEELGYGHRPLAETVADTLAWYQTRKRLRPRGFGRWWLRPAAVPVGGVG